MWRVVFGLVLALEIIGIVLTARAWRSEVAYWTQASDDAPVSAIPKVNLVLALGVSGQQDAARAESPAAWQAVSTDPGPLRVRSQAAWALAGYDQALAKPDQAPDVWPMRGFIAEDRQWLATVQSDHWWKGRPLTRLTLRLQAWRDASVWEYRAVNALIHLATALMLWRLSGSWPIALVWALLPWHVETIATLGGRGEVLQGVTLLVTCLALSAQRWGWALLAVTCLALTKESAVVALVLLPLWLEMWPLLGIGAGALVGLCLWHRWDARVPYIVPSPWEWACAQATVIGMQLARLFQPLIYVEPRDRAAWVQALALIAHGVVGVVLPWMRRHAPEVAFGLSWALLALIPRFIVPTPEAYLHTRHLYVPSMGLVWALAGRREGL